MNDLALPQQPAIYPSIKAKSEEIGFTMPSDMYIGSLLKTLISSKPNGSFLELGTGVGLSLSWMIDGMDETSKLITVDNDPKLSAIAMEFFGKDSRVNIVCQDGTTWIQENKEMEFDLIFADAWPGKYSELDEILSMVKVGGLYVIDDMKAQPNWPEGHEEKATALIASLEKRADYNLTKMNWSTGVILSARKF